MTSNQASKTGSKTEAFRKRAGSAKLTFPRRKPTIQLPLQKKLIAKMQMKNVQIGKLANLRQLWDHDLRMRGTPVPAEIVVPSPPETVQPPNSRARKPSDLPDLRCLTPEGREFLSCLLINPGSSAKIAKICRLSRFFRKF